MDRSSEENEKRTSKIISNLVSYFKQIGFRKTRASYETNEFASNYLTSTENEVDNVIEEAKARISTGERVDTFRQFTLLFK